MKFRIKAPEVEAMHFARDRVEHVKDFLEGIDHSLAIERSLDGKCLLEIRLTNYHTFVPVGYWIVKEPSNQIRVFSPEDFIKLYEPIDQAGLAQESHENH